MIRIVRRCLPSVFAGLAGCASAPVHYHTLLAPAGQETAARPSPFVVDVLPVGVPVQADLAQFVVRQGAGGVAVLDGERWAAPLGDEVRAALSAALVHGLGTQDVAGLARPADSQVMRIKVQVRRFDLWPGQRAQLDADWSLGVADEPGRARLTCRGRFDAPAPGGYPALVQAQQKLVLALADRIGADARAWWQMRGAACGPADTEVATGAHQ